MRLVGRDAERVGQVGAVQVVPQVQLDDLAVAGVQPADGGQHQAAQVGALGLLADVGAGVGHLAGLVQVGLPGPAAQPAVALVAAHRVQPGAEPVGVPQAAELGGGDDEGVLDRVGGVGGLAEQGPAVGMQAGRVLVIGRG